MGSAWPIDPVVVGLAAQALSASTATPVQSSDTNGFK